MVGEVLPPNYIFNSRDVALRHITPGEDTETRCGIYMPGGFVTRRGIYMGKSIRLIGAHK